MVCIPVGLLPAFTTQGIDMHYYKRNLGDYAKKAGRLSLLQHGSYTVLIDSCYDREQFPTLEQAIEWTWADSVEEIEAVKFVLRKFFILEDGIYVQNRIREEIAEYHEKASINKRIAIDRETKRKESNANRERTVDEASPNHKPITKNQEPVTKNQEPRTKNQEPEESKSKDLRGSRLSYSQIVEEWVDWAILERPELTAAKVHSIYDQFYDYWKAQPGSKGIKLDWFATWRNWVRRDKSFGRVERLSIADQNRAVVDAFNLKLDQQEEGAIYEHE